MQLPAEFIQTIEETFKGDGIRFLKNLPALIEEASARWDVSEVKPVSNLSFNFVAFAKRGADDVVLKLGVPQRELTSEIAALRVYDGRGACRLLDADAVRGFLLLERLRPGEMLSKLEDDDARTHIAVDVMRALWRPVPPDTSTLINLSDWFGALKRIRSHFGGGSGSFAPHLLERVDSMLPELFSAPLHLIHGDFHHFNILSSDRGWLAIDPKGVIGPLGYEVGPLMLNPWESISDAHLFKVQTERRVSILAERLNWPRQLIIQWALAHAILSACWSIEDGMDGSYSLRCAEAFSELK